MTDFPESIFSDKFTFSEKTGHVFRFQFHNNRMYRDFVKTLGISESLELQPTDIPLLPIRAFRDHVVKSTETTPSLCFKSSGTAGIPRSRHFVQDAQLYKTSAHITFNRYFPEERYSVLFLLPGYSENESSSLIYMAEYLIHSDPDQVSAFIRMNEIQKAIQSIKNIADRGKTPILFGAAFGLLDLIESESFTLPRTSHMIETGGMKTYRREITRSELRSVLSHGFDIPAKQIHSEYGMCELLSQMYAISGEWFEAPPWVMVTVRDAENPFRICEPGEEGKIGIIDLANFYSCSFILTDDRGVMNDKGEFKVLGRWKGSELRGCNFLVDS
ncbi:MAG: hypothetical protein EA360_07565 [Balneolaceae bacterium]|nr:MAG: hypothetical protein EA360_07565 [Balneolaceae bacterium]